MYEIFTVDNITAILGLFTGGSLGMFFTWQYARRKAKAEAVQAEADAEKAQHEAVAAAIQATKDMQDMYQQLNADIKADRDEQKAYIVELKDDRHHLRAERDELRRRQDELEKAVRGLQRDVARNGRLVRSMRPLLCGAALTCERRQPVTISEDVGAEPPMKKDIEPYDDRDNA